MLNFLKVEHSPHNVAKLLVDDVTEFHRSHTSINFELYTAEQLQSVQREIQSVRNELAKFGKGNFRLNEYIT